MAATTSCGSVAPTDPEEQIALISAFTTKLALRPDGDRVRALLAAAFVEHHRELWPFGDPNATPQWIEGHVDEMLATIERLYGEAICGPMAHAFLNRMAWLPPLLAELDQPACRSTASTRSPLGQARPSTVGKTGGS
jgi:hypothetical protein